MACKRSGVRVSVAPRFRRSEAICADLDRLLIVQEVTLSSELICSGVLAGQHAAALLVTMLAVAGAGWEPKWEPMGELHAAAGGMKTSRAARCTGNSAYARGPLQEGGPEGWTAPGAVGPGGRIEGFAARSGRAGELGHSPGLRGACSRRLSLTKRADCPEHA